MECRKVVLMNRVAVSSFSSALCWGHFWCGTTQARERHGRAGLRIKKKKLRKQQCISRVLRKQVECLKLQILQAASVMSWQHSAPKIPDVWVLFQYQLLPKAASLGGPGLQGPPFRGAEPPVPLCRHPCHLPGPRVLGVLSAWSEEGV